MVHELLYADINFFVAAVKFAKEGYTVVAMNRTAESFEAVDRRLKEVGAKYSFQAMDATDPDSVKGAFAQVHAELGRVDVLVYNTGGGGFGIPILEIKPEAFLQSFQASCVGALLCTQAVLPAMLASKGTGPREHGAKTRGTILYTSATSGFRGARCEMIFSLLHSVE
jgi:NAD(P)-dependent dehydrogenase (short-subunit alcohol dehydrogenase family)